MLFLVSVIDDRSGSGTAAEMAAIDTFNDRLRTDGHWVLAGGLVAPEEATVIDARGDEPVVTPGPFTRTDEHVAGFWVIEASDGDAAREIATEGSRACHRRVEVRAFL